MSRFDGQLADDSGISCLGYITLPDKKMKSNNYQYLCVRRLTNILVSFLFRPLNWIERCSTMKSDVSSLFEYT